MSRSTLLELVDATGGGFGEERWLVALVTGLAAGLVTETGFAWCTCGSERDRVWLDTRGLSVDLGACKQ